MEFHKFVIFQKKSYVNLYGFMFLQKYKFGLFEVQLRLMIIRTLCYQRLDRFCSSQT